MNLLTLGDLTAPEMQPVLAAVDALSTVETERRTVPSLAELRLIVEAGWTPDIVIVAQRHPGEFTEADVVDAIGLLPLVRWVCCLGIWCESAGRNGIAWPWTVCVPARACRLRVEAEFDVVRGHRDPLPLTASRDESFGFDAESICPPEAANGLVAVESPDRALRALVEDVLRAAGWQVAPDDRNVDVIVWDADPWKARLPTLPRPASGASGRVVALMAMAHPEDLQELRTAGVPSVVSKLAIAAELPDAVAAAISDHECSSNQGA